MCPVVPQFTNYSLSSLSNLIVSDDNIDETYGVNVQFESDEEVSVKTSGPTLFLFFEIVP